MVVAVDSPIVTVQPSPVYPAFQEPRNPVESVTRRYGVSVACPMSPAGTSGNPEPFRTIVGLLPATTLSTSKLVDADTST
jgi:hypothetical protein